MTKVILGVRALGADNVLVDGQIAIDLVAGSTRREHHRRSVSVHTIDPGPHQRYLADEIAFLNYRLDVVSRWPDSEHRAATTQAIMARLRAFKSLISTIGPSPEDSRAVAWQAPTGRAIWCGATRPT